MWKQIQAKMRKCRLKLGRYFWDRREKKERIKIGNFIEKNNIQSIVFLRQDGKIGDMVVNTFVFRSIKKQYPHIKIAVITRGAAKDIIENNPDVDKIFDFQKEKKQIKTLTAKIAEEKYDLLVDFSGMLRVRDMMLISLCKARYNIGVNREDWDMFDISIPFDFQSHITNLYASFLKRVGISEVDMHYHLACKDSHKKEEDYILFNPYAASHHRSFSKRTVLELASEVLKLFPNYKICIVGQKENAKELHFFQKELGEKCKTVITESIQGVFPAIKNAKLVITPDTSIVHIAVAFNKKMIAFYREDKEDGNSKVWGPNSTIAEQIYTQSEDINFFSWEDFRGKLKKIVGEKK